MKRKRTSTRRAALTFLCVLMGLILTVMLVATVALRYLLNQIRYEAPEDTPTLSQEQLEEFLAGEEEEAPDPDTPTMDPEDVTFSNHTTSISSRDANIVNILLIGQDRRPGETRARSDSMILCTFQKDTGKMTMTSFLRDLYLQIPGYQDNRINVAYAAGGMPLLKETFLKNFGIAIDGCVEVDFTQFAKLVDLLGGVRLDLRHDEAVLINRSTGSALTEGSNLLLGDQALTYARIRNLDGDGDFSRTNRQRKVMGALIEAYKSASLSSLLTLLDQALGMVTTDMTGAQIVGYATELFPMLSELEIASQRIPADGTYQGRMIRGMAVLVADMEQTRQILEETLLPSP